MTVSGSSSSSSAGRSVVALDLLRGLAAITVLLVHARGSSFVGFPELPADQRSVLVGALFGLTRLGPEAVLAFFVLSGFLVGGQIVSRLRDGSFRLSDYAVDRCSRILLPLIPACLFTEAVNVFVFRAPDRVVDLVGTMCGLGGLVVNGIGNNAPLWTLTYEIWFYAAGGAAGVLISRGRNRVPALLAAALCVVVFSRLDARFLLYWVAGAAMMLCLDIGPRKILAVAGVALGASAGALQQLASIAKSSVNLPSVEVSEALIVVGVCLALPGLCDAAFDKRIGHLRRFAGAIGGFSYSLYLIHAPIIAILDSVLPKSAAITPLSIAYFALRVAVAVAAGVIFYSLFERNTDRLRRCIKSRRSASPAPVEPSPASTPEHAV